jgi:hypothetical protein
LVGSTDLIAISVMEVIKAAGYRVPEDVAVVGFSGELLLSPSLLAPNCRLCTFGGLAHPLPGEAARMLEFYCVVRSIEYRGIVVAWHAGRCSCEGECIMQAWRMRPPPTQQGALTCWAAAISAFARVTPGIPKWGTPEDVITEFKKHPTLQFTVNTDNSLRTPRGWRFFANIFGLEIEEIRFTDPLTGRVGSATRGIVSHAAAELIPTHFVPKLRRSHVITVIAPRNPKHFSHTVVVYGADTFRLCFMDPLRDPLDRTIPPRPVGGSGRVAMNWFCETYLDFSSGPRYLLIWRA